MKKLLIGLVFALAACGSSEAAGPGATEAPAVTEATTTTIPETAGQRNAKRSAQSYLNYTAFSRPGLIDQLIYEGYSKADATYAVDSLDVDWMQQAVESAKDYLDYTSFSRQGLIDQLVYEGFTTKQAKHGVSIAYN